MALAGYGHHFTTPGNITTIFPYDLVESLDISSKYIVTVITYLISTPRISRRLREPPNGRHFHLPFARAFFR